VCTGGGASVQLTILSAGARGRPGEA